MTQVLRDYDFDVRFTPDEVLTLAASRSPGQVPHAIGSDGKNIDPNGPSLMTALREQLGLKLDAETGPVEMLVVDSTERPTPDYNCLRTSAPSLTSAI